MVVYLQALAPISDSLGGGTGFQKQQAQPIGTLVTPDLVSGHLGTYPVG